MCGICGIVDFQRPIDGRLLARMNAVLTHRGPDDEGFYLRDPAALAMRRLSIIDLATGHQPISNEDETIWIIFNGEVYNFQSLREALIQRGHRFRTASDTETIVHLYEEHGLDFVRHMIGMFAIALWDRRHDRLVLVRDRLGIKPLYYALHAGRLRFASETKALLQDDDLPRTLDPLAIVAYLNFNSLPGPDTMFREIRKLPPGHLAIFDRAGLRIEQYWNVDYSRQRAWREDELLEAVEALLRDSIRLRMISDVPLGAFLSGGIDSSLVVALMAEISTAPVEAFSIGYGAEGAFMNEFEYSQAVAERCGARHHKLTLTSDDLLKDVDRVAWFLDEPCGDPAAFLTLALSEFTRRHVTVALSGIGGDELFAGYRRYRAIQWQNAYRRVPRFVRQGLIRPLLSVLPESRTSRWANLSRLARKFNHDVDSDARAFYRNMVSYLPEFAGPLFAGDAMRVHRETFRHGEFERHWDAVPLTASDIDRAMYVDTKMYLADQLLFLQDKMTMAASLESREPLLDYRFVELAATVPATQKLRGGQLKFVLKRLAERHIPRHCIYREKKGFVAPIGAWFRGPLRERLHEALHPDRVRRRGIFQVDYVEWMKRAFFDEGRDLSVQLYQAFMLETWFNLFVDGGGRRFSATVSDAIASPKPPSPVATNPA